MHIKILLADDHKVFRQGLRSLIAEQPDMSVVAEAENGEAAVQLASTLLPDIAIMDISMLGMNGIEATRQTLTVNSATKVIALSMHLNKQTVLDMLNAGAMGYLLKDCAFEELIEAIHGVFQNRHYLSPSVFDLVFKEFIQKIPAKEFNPLFSLTLKERKTLQLLADGKNNREIADILKVSEKTAEVCRQRIKEKLNIHSIAELTKFAIREGLTTL